MTHRSLSIAAFVLVASTIHVACSSSVEGGDPSLNPGSDAGAPPAADAASDSSAPADADTSGKVGTLIDKGVVSVSADLSSKTSWTCDSVCKAKAGTCTDGRNGAGNVSRKYNNGSGTFSNRISDCDSTESYASGNTTMTSMECYCDGLPVAPTVRVKKTEGFHPCGDVCATWSLTCAKDRKSYAFVDEEETTSTVIACDVAPADTAHHYVCACASIK